MTSHKISLVKPSPVRKVAVFCGAKTGNDPLYLNQAHIVGAFLAKSGIELIYGGLNLGLMGALASSALSHGGAVTGIVPTHFEKSEIIQDNLTQLIEVNDLSERKEQMLSLADGFIALPGGSGTLDEIFEVITLSQMGQHKKPCAFLNINRFYDPLISFLTHAQKSGFIHPDYINMLIVSENIEETINCMQSFTHPHLS